MKYQESNYVEKICQTLSKNLKKAVEATGKTPYTLSASFGFDKGLIGNLLKGNRDPKFSSLVRLAEAMKVSVDELMELPERKKEILAKGSVEYYPTQQEKHTEPSSIPVKEVILSLNQKIAEMSETDIELLCGIADLLEARRKKGVVKLLKAALEKNRSALAEVSPLKEKLPLSRYDDEDETDEYEDPDWDEEDEDWEEEEEYDDEDEDDEYEDEDWG